MNGRGIPWGRCGVGRWHANTHHSENATQSAGAQRGPPAPGLLDPGEISILNATLRVHHTVAMAERALRIRPRTAYRILRRARTAMTDRIDGITRSSSAARTRIKSTPATASKAPGNTSETHTRPARDERSRTIAPSSSGLVRAEATSGAGIPQVSSQTTAAGQPARASPRSVGSNLSLSVELPSHSVNAVASPELCALLARLIRRRRACLKGDAAA
jgi:hypothetical protein